MPEYQMFNIYVNRPPKELYEQVWKPETFPSWASGLSKTSLKRDETGWKFQSPDGVVRVTFTDHNDFYVMDHTVHLPGGKTPVYVPMRIVANGEGSEVMMMLFRGPDMDDKKYELDSNWIKKDLKALKELAERS